MVICFPLTDAEYNVLMQHVFEMNKAMGREGDDGLPYTYYLKQYVFNVVNGWIEQKAEMEHAASLGTIARPQSMR